MGGREWQHASGVPGIGSSRLFYECSASTLQLWEDKPNNKVKKNGLLQLFGRLSLMAKRTKKKRSLTQNSTSVILPKVSLRRTKSFVSPNLENNYNHDMFSVNSDLPPKCSYCVSHHRSSRRFQVSDLENSVVNYKYKNSKNKYSGDNIHDNRGELYQKYIKDSKHSDSVLQVVTNNFLSQKCDNHSKSLKVLGISDSHIGDKTHSKETANNYRMHTPGFIIETNTVSHSNNHISTTKPMHIKKVKRSKTVHEGVRIRPITNQVPNNSSFGFRRFNSSNGQSSVKCSKHLPLQNMNQDSCQFPNLSRTKSVTFATNIDKVLSRSPHDPFYLNKGEDYISKTDNTRGMRKYTMSSLIDREYQPKRSHDQEYSYAYSDSISPAMMIQQEYEKEEENIYEEINTNPDKSAPDKSNLEDSNVEDMLSDISLGRRKSLLRHKFADWNMDNAIDKHITEDNYIGKVKTKKDQPHQLENHGKL